MVWVIVAVIAVVLFAAWFVMRRRPTAARGGPEAPAEVAPPQAEPAEAVAAGSADAAHAQPVSERGGVSGEEGKPTDRPVGKGAAAETVEPAASVVEPEVETESAVEEEPVAAPAVSLRSQVEAQLEESARLLGELRESALGAEEGSALDAGSVEIMEEGLKEIRALAERKQWGQARDKGKALHAQLTLLLQNARRGKSR